MHGSVRRIAIPVAALVLAAAPGCSRKFFRERADCDVEGIITQKNVFPDWAIHNWHVYPDKNARYADPFNPDRPPYPPDDYAAKVLSPNPQKPKKKWGAGRYEGQGYIDLLEQWDAENRAADAPSSMPQPEPVAPPIPTAVGTAGARVARPGSPSAPSAKAEGSGPPGASPTEPSPSTGSQAFTCSSQSALRAISCSPHRGQAQPRRPRCRGVTAHPRWKGLAREAGVRRCAGSRP